MENGLSFFSSPLRPMPNPWQRSTTTFYTPQQDSKYNWTSAFAPTSPSPLRTSRNANLMSSPLQPSDTTFGKHLHPDEADENTQRTTPQTPNPNQPQAPSTTATTSSPFIFSPPTSDLPAAVPNHSTLFQFSDRARSSSPSALLQSHTRDNRASRKRLFLDRLKSKRDDARSERTGDQVLRLDFMRERRKWEEEKARSGHGWEPELDVGVGVGDEMADGAEMSPTEEKEIEELTSGYYGRLEPGYQNVEMDEFEDDGYDEVFMEVLSQESVGRAVESDRGGAGNNGREVSEESRVHQHQPQHQHQHQHQAHGVDADMDLS